MMSSWSMCFFMPTPLKSLLLRCNHHVSSCNWVSQANLLSESADIEEGAGRILRNLFLVLESVRLFEQQKDASERKVSTKKKPIHREKNRPVWLRSICRIRFNVFRDRGGVVRQSHTIVLENKITTQEMPNRAVSRCVWVDDRNYERSLSHFCRNGSTKAECWWTGSGCSCSGMPWVRCNMILMDEHTVLRELLTAFLNFDIWWRGARSWRGLGVGHVKETFRLEVEIKILGNLCDDNHFCKLNLQRIPIEKCWNSQWPCWKHLSTE